MPWSKRSLLNSSHGLCACLSVTPNSHTCRVGFELSQKSLLQGGTLENQIGYLETVQHVQAYLIQRGDCGERGLAMLSFHVITSHIRIVAPVDEL